MTVTVKSLAKAAGVSRGTVDRVLHDRGSVKKELAIKIKALAKEMGYVPNRGGKNLAWNTCVEHTISHITVRCRFMTTATAKDQSHSILFQILPDHNIAVRQLTKNIRLGQSQSPVDLSF